VVNDFKVIEVTAQDDVVRGKFNLTYPAPEQGSFVGGVGSVYVDDY
jgi:hypothetical protein